jgi:Tfp pilus assembly protein PilF
MAKAHYQLAKLYLQRRETSNALNELLFAIRYDSEDHEAYTILGELLLRGRDFNRAKEIAGNMVEKWPNNLVATLISAETTLDTGDWPKARDSVEQIMKEDPKDARASFDLARLDLQSKQWRSAETNFG